MLDTVAIGVQVDGLKAGELYRRGWDVRTKTNLQGGDLWASHELGGVKLAFLAGIGRLQVEASLPIILSGDNAGLIGPSGCGQALAMVREVACAATGRDLPAVGEWKVARFDPVWAWETEPSAYIGALSVARLPRTEPVHYSGSVRWVTRGNRVRARCYDKARERLEAGKEGKVELPLRFERQVRRREPIRVDGKVIEGRAVDDLLSDRVAFALLRAGLKALGLDRPIPSLQATRDRLRAHLGHRAGLTAFGVLQDVLSCGGLWPSYYSQQSRRKYERRWREAGVSVLSPLGELPPLELPTLPER